MNLNRRDFLGGLSSLACFSALTGCKCPIGGCTGARCTGARYAAQLYSIYQIFWKQPEKCLDGLRAAGIEGVEFAGYDKHTAKEIRKLLADAGMVGMGTHVNGFTCLVGDALKETLDFCAEAGLESVVTPHAICKTEAEYRKFGRDMSYAAEAAKAWGVKVGIHTTYDHFTMKFNGVTAWDTIFAEASPLLQQQIDTGNTFHTGTDVVALLKKYRGRHHSVHLKENIPTKTATLGEPTTDGAPNVPWNDVLACLAEEVVAWYVIETEMIPDSLQPLADSVKFLDRVRSLKILYEILQVREKIAPGGTCAEATDYDIISAQF